MAVSLSSTASAAGPPASITQRDGALDLRKVNPSKKLVAELLKSAKPGTRVPIMVTLSTRWKPEAKLTKAAAAEQRRAVARMGTSAVKDLGKHAKLRRAIAGLPVFSLNADRWAIAKLAEDKDIASVEPVRQLRPDDAASNFRQAVSTAHRIGARGAGMTVAVIDTGVDHTHPSFGGRVVKGACFSRDRLCPNGQTTDTGVDAGRPCTKLEGCDHGTHVAGVAAGRSNAYGDGVAPDAQIVSVMAASEGSGEDAGKPVFADDDVVNALKWIATDSAEHSKVAAVNLSLGGDEKFTQRCTSWAYLTAVSELYAQGTAVVAAAGNEGWRDGVAHPGCNQGVITVGSVNNLDKVSSFSNAASFMQLWASGDSVDAAVPGGGYLAKGGTSMAAPQVAGAFAVLRSLAPTRKVEEYLQLIYDTGASVKDTRTGGTVTTRRLNLYAAVLGLAKASWLAAPTTTVAGPSADDSDFNGDGRQDVTVWRPSNGTWYTKPSTSGTVALPFVETRFGQAGDIPVPADYDGDGKTDVAVFRSNKWYWKRSSDGADGVPVAWGDPGDILAPGDYNGDGRTDVGVFRPRLGKFFWRDTLEPGKWGEIRFGEFGDIPVPGDYDGDKITDFAVFRPWNGLWAWTKSTAPGTFGSITHGEARDTPVPGDWDADGKVDPAFNRGSYWFRTLSWSNYAVESTSFGVVSDRLVHGDYDGDGDVDLGVVRGADKATNAWHARGWAGTLLRDGMLFGFVSDVAIR